MRLSLEKPKSSRFAICLALTGSLMLGPGCGLGEQDPPPGYGPSETGVSVELIALPDRVNADGVSQAVVELVVRDQNGAPIGNKAVEFIYHGDGTLLPEPGSTYVGPLQTSIVMATDGNGVARVLWVAGTTIQTVVISVRPYGIDATRYFFSSIEISQV